VALAPEPMRTRHFLAVAFLAGMIPICTTLAQQSIAPGQAASLDSLVAHAIAVSPALHIARARIDAARSRVQPASALPDPMLMFGIINQPLGAMAGSAGPDPMTMRMIGVGQKLLYPGKLALQGRIAEQEVEASESYLDAARRKVVRDIKSIYYEIAFTDRALSIVERNRDVLANLIAVSQSRYSVGVAPQQDILKARLEATRLAETAAGLLENRRARAAQLNALLDRPTEAPVPTLAVPDAITRAAVSSTSDAVRFTSAALGSRAADSPLRPLEELQEQAIQSSPEIREHESMIAAQALRVELARKEHLPDIDLSIQYGQRGGGLPDMISATVSLPIPVFKGRKQDQQVALATAQFETLEGEHHEKVNAIRAEVARLVSEVERERTKLALSVKAILPQSRAALTSAVGSFQVGKVEFQAVLENQAIVFNYETEYFRALSDFATSVAELERVVGQEVLK
jgi:outer membrane protein, heavy metal efflux system